MNDNEKLREATLLDQASIEDLIRAMDAGRNPLGFTNPGGALVQLKLYLFNTYSVSVLVPFPLPRPDFLPQRVVERPTPPAGAIGVPDRAPPPRELPAPNPVPSVEDSIERTNRLGGPNIAPAPRPLGTPDTKPPRPRPTPQGPTPDELIVRLINDP